jgi:RND family efflux transporter MFP subunit
MVKTVTGTVNGIIAVFVFCVAAGPAWAAPVNVVVGQTTRGVIVPEKTYVGTVYYPEVSNVSAEVSGAVLTLQCEDGQRVEKGDPLAILDASILKKTRLSRLAIYEQTLSDLEKASKDLERSQTLFDRKIIASKDLDDHRFNVVSLEKKAASLKAEVDRLDLEIDKTVIRAPYSGVVVKRLASRGEWLSPGSPVATVAVNTIMDVVVSVPEETLAFLTTGMPVNVTAGGVERKGAVRAILPRGDIATRTFSVKIGVKNGAMLKEGMEARAKLPTGKKIDVLMVHRDAILNVSGKTFIVAVVDSRASMIPVSVSGYQGMKAGIEQQNLQENMTVVLKGNERLRNGQEVTVVKEIR